MKLLVTGGTGFIGATLIRHLRESGHEVGAVVRRTSMRQHLLAADGVRLVVVDGSTNQLVDVVGAERPDVVVHLASCFLVQHAASDIDALVEDNVRFGLQLLEAMRAAGVRRMVSAGTYWQRFERDTYRPVNLYAATKQAFEDLAAYYVDAERFAITHLYLYDVYGPGDQRPKLLQHLIKSMQTGETLDMSPGEQRLDLVHVDDVAAAFIAAAERLCAAKAAGHEQFAVSSGAPISLRELVRLLSDVAGRPLPVRFGGREYRAREVMTPWNAGRPVPGWRPRIGLKDGLASMLHAHV